MNLKLKKMMRVVLCIIFSMCFLFGCGEGKTEEKTEDKNNSESANTLDEKKCSKEEYVARITAYKEYYEGIENDYCSVSGAILVNENGSPYMVLCCSCSSEEEMDEYKIVLIDYKDGKTVINGEKVFYGEENDYGGYRNCDVDIAFVNDRCVMKMEISAGEGGTEYWEFEKDNLVAQKIGDEENKEKVGEINSSGYVYDVSKKPFVYLYSYGRGKVVGYNYDQEIYDTKYTIYDQVSDIESVNKIVVPRLYDYMQLTDEQKEYFVFPKKEPTEVAVSDVANIYSDDVWQSLSYHRWMKGVSFKQCLNELMEEPIYRIEDLMIKEINFACYNKFSKDVTQKAMERKEELLKAIEEQMPKKNPYSTDKELLETYYNGVKNALEDWLVAEKSGECKDKDLATIMTMDNEFAKELKKYLTEDYVFTSDELKGATWKDIVYSGGALYPILTVTKNGNTLSVPVIDDPKMKEAIDAYVAYGFADWFAYDFAYIDDDDYPELIRRYVDPQWEMYTYKNGTVTYLECDEFNSLEWAIKNYEPKANKIILEGYDDNWNSISTEAHIQGNKIVRSTKSNNDQNNDDNSEIEKALNAYAAKAVEKHYGIALAYIDEDDIPEMIVCKCESDSLRYVYSVIYSYKKGKITEYTNGWSIYKYIPKADRFIENEEYQAFWEEEGVEYSNTDWREVIVSMKGVVNENIPSDMFESIEYSDDFEKAKEKIQK